MTQLSRSLSRMNIDPLLWFVHFGDILPENARCEDCADFLAGVCHGGHAPWRCMANTRLLRSSERKSA